jgi:RNA polymerase sigma-70 factor (ECF subfamily)
MDLREKVHEQVLVLRCQAGDCEAFESLYERYHVSLTYYLRRLLESPETADDVLQIVWLKVLREIRRVRHSVAFRVWLYRLARNEALQHIRRDRRWAEVEQSLSVTQPDEHEDGFSAEDAERVHAALARISPVHREVLVLRYLEELSYEEIASVVGCELGTVRSRLHYAKRAMRRVLEERNDDEQERIP